MNDTGSAERALVTKLARGSLLSRLKRSRQPLKLAAVPRDHVQGDRQRGDALLAGRLMIGSDTISLADIDFAAIGATGIAQPCSTPSRAVLATSIPAPTRRRLA